MYPVCDQYAKKYMYVLTIGTNSLSKLGSFTKLTVRAAWLVQPLHIYTTFRVSFVKHFAKNISRHGFPPKNPSGRKDSSKRLLNEENRFGTRALISIEAAMRLHHVITSSMALARCPGRPYFCEGVEGAGGGCRVHDDSKRG